MDVIDITFPTPELNLACDEALLDWCESGHPRELLRFWEPRQPFVVLGYGGRLAAEVRPEALRANVVPVLRRCSGGGTVLQGSGCLNYALILRIPRSGPLVTIPGTNRSILERHARALEPLAGGPIQRRGDTDLALGERKFSGNSQRRKRTHLLFHGCILLEANLEVMERLLPVPQRRPAYRLGRSHREFLTGLTVPAEAAKAALRACWNAETPSQESLPLPGNKRLAQARYANSAWTNRL